MPSSCRVLKSRWQPTPSPHLQTSLSLLLLGIGKSNSRPPNPLLAYCGATGRPHQRLSCLGSPGAICGPVLALGYTLGCSLRHPLGPNSPISAPGQFCGLWENVWVEQKLSALHLFDARSSQQPRGAAPQVARALSIDQGHERPRFCTGRGFYQLIG